MKITEQECKRAAYAHYFPECNGECRPGWCLHHKDPSLKKNDKTRYHEWRIEDLRPMLSEDHNSLHQLLAHPKLYETTKKHIKIQAQKRKESTRSRNIKLGLKRYTRHEIICVETGEVFKNVCEAARKFETSRQNMHHAVNTYGALNGKYHFKYADDTSPTIERETFTVVLSFNK